MNADRLYESLPSLYRERDVEQGYPLRALLRIVTSQADLIDRDIERLYDDLFVETCRPWVIPYIGDLVGADALSDAARSDAGRLASALFEDLTGRDLRPPLAARSRTDVAKTISYRRRKGTLPMLEELARDVTGWAAHAVEFLDLVGWTQHLEHGRPSACWADLRSVEAMGRVGGPFDATSHTADVRHPTQHAGWHHHRHVGFFLWRLAAFPLEDVPARQGAAPWRYHFSPLGQPAPLFSRLRREGDEAGLATELHVPGPIRGERFWADLVAYRARRPPRPPHTELYGETAATSFAIRRNGEFVAPAADAAAEPDDLEPRIVCRRLRPWPADPPSGRVIAVDVTAGRLAVGDGWPDATAELDVSYHHGFGAALGGGSYERGAWLVRPELAELRIGVKADGVAPPGAPPLVVASVADALAAWQAAGRPDAIVTILDSRTYALPSFALRNEGWLAIEAANGERPLLRTAAGGVAIDVLAPVQPGDPDRRAALTLGGVVVEGFLRVNGDLGRLRLLHATLVPGRALDEEGDPVGSDPSLSVRATQDAEPINTQLRVELAFSIAGELRVPRHAEGIWVLDSIVDGVQQRAIGGPQARPGPPLAIERSTVLGETLAASLEASETVFAGTVQVERTQGGCARFSFLPAESRTPRRYRCQPDLAVASALEAALALDPGLGTPARAALRARVEGRVVPTFTARRYGQPAYAQLHLGSPRELREGAEDGAEMGAFSHVKHTQRTDNLRRRVEEYLPFGLQAGLIYVT